MIDVWQKFTKGMTNVGVRFRDEELSEKMLPCLTACPWNAFKKPGKKFTRKTLQLTFFVYLKLNLLQRLSKKGFDSCKKLD